MGISVAAASILAFNIPFGYWRQNVRRFSLQWFLAIHLPIPFAITERLLSGIGFRWMTYPVMLAAFVLGQYFGTKLFRYMKDKKQFRVTSCFVMDCFRNCF